MFLVTATVLTHREDLGRLENNGELGTKYEGSEIKGQLRYYFEPTINSCKA